MYPEARRWMHLSFLGGLIGRRLVSTPCMQESVFGRQHIFTASYKNETLF